MGEISRGDLDNYRRDAVIEGARALAAKLEEINADPSFKGIWGFLHVHGYVYIGPSYENALAVLRSAIVNLDRESTGSNG